MFARQTDPVSEAAAFRTVELRPGAALGPGTYAVRLAAGAVTGVYGPMRGRRRGSLLPYEYAEFPYQTSPRMLAAMQCCLVDQVEAEATVPAGAGWRLALAVALGVCVSCAVSWFALTG